MKISRNAAVPTGPKQGLRAYARGRHRAPDGGWNAAKKFGLDLRLYERPGFLLWRARHIADSIFTRECSKLGITSPQYLVLAVLQEIPGTDQVGVSRIAGLDRFTTALVLSNLLKRELIIRERSITDRRCYSLRLSLRGLAALRRILPGAARAHTRLLSPFTRSERRKFIEILQKLVTTLNCEARAPVDEDALPLTRSQSDRLPYKKRRNGARR
ncbi:MAG TPA: MarR family transcriptional regulator [Candidatus Acidoferrales bacterium]|nr:MarR family transcriptional regulator [Candidatus Acidoferrales bacterium]